MAKGISVGITSETQGFEAGVKSGVIKPLEAVVDATEDAAAAGRKAGDQLEQAFDSAGDAAKDLGKDGKRGGDDIEAAMRAAQRETSDLQTEYKQLGDTVKRESREAGRDTRNNFKDGTDGAREGLKDFKDEASSTARESAASFDGSAESIADSFQEIAANAFVGFGPAAAVAGLAAAAGIGLAGAAFTANQEKADQMAEVTNDAYDRMIEAGGRYLSTEVQNAAIQDVIKDKWKEIKEISEITGVSASDVARAYALGGTELETVKGRLNEVYDANNELITKGEGFTEVLVDQNGKIGKQVEALNGVVGVQAEALRMAEAYDAATGGAVKKRSDERDQIQDRNRALTETPKTVKTTLEVDDSAITRALIKKTLKVTIDTVDRLGKKID